MASVFTNSHSQQYPLEAPHPPASLKERSASELSCTVHMKQNGEQEVISRWQLFHTCFSSDDVAGGADSGGGADSVGGADSGGEDFCAGGGGVCHLTVKNFD